MRNELLQLPDEKMADVAVFCNNYPSIDIAVKVEDPDDVVAGEAVRIKVTLEREMDEEDEMDEDAKEQVGVVSSPLFPGTKREGWWLVVGDTSNNSLLSLKRISVQMQGKTVALEFLAPEEPGDYSLTLFLMSDSYLGCDQEHSVQISVAPPDDDDDEDSDDDDSDE